LVSREASIFSSGVTLGTQSSAAELAGFMFDVRHDKTGEVVTYWGWGHTASRVDIVETEMKATERAHRALEAEILTLGAIEEFPADPGFWWEGEPGP
jgi:hypothetical protein